MEPFGCRVNADLICITIPEKWLGRFVLRAPDARSLRRLSVYQQCYGGNRQRGWDQVSTVRIQIQIQIQIHDVQFDVVVCTELVPHKKTVYAILCFLVKRRPHNQFFRPNKLHCCINISQLFSSCLKNLSTGILYLSVRQSDPVTQSSWTIGGFFTTRFQLGATLVLPGT